MNYYAMTDDVVAKLLGERVERYRLKKNVLQDDVASAVDISRPTYHNLTLGKTTLQTLYCVMNFLGRHQDFEALFPVQSFSPLKVLERKKQGAEIGSDSPGSDYNASVMKSLPELAQRLQALRQSKNMSIPVMAHESGISAPTMRRLLVSGKGSLINLVSALRILDALDALDRFLPDADSDRGTSPMEALKNQRQRATGSRTEKLKNDSSDTDLGW